MIIQTENKNFVRDLNSKALLLNKKTEHDEYMSRSRMLNEQKQQRSDIDSIKNELGDIKDLLRRIVENNGTITNNI